MAHGSRSYGVMQGRLSTPEDGRFQCFPRIGWRDEFARARVAGFDYIEWIHDSYGEPVNPIFSDVGLREFDALKAAYGIATPALCADWLMEYPFVRCSLEERRRRVEHFHELFAVARRIGAARIVLPLVDNASVTSVEEEQAVIDILEGALPIAERHGVEVHVEADFGPDAFRAFLARIQRPSLKVNWDTGNSSGLAFIAHEEFAAYGERIGSVHIKDRLRKPNGGIETLPLGTGSADFDDVFAAMHASDYRGGVTLQVARGAPGEEVDFLRTQLDFVRRYW